MFLIKQKIRKEDIERCRVRVISENVTDLVNKDERKVSEHLWINGDTTRLE